MDSGWMPHHSQGPPPGKKKKVIKDQFLELEVGELKLNFFYQVTNFALLVILN